jgi:hypothetical protein
MSDEPLPQSEIAVGFRVRSHRGTQFRQWAISRLNEYLLKGFTMDDERLRNPPGEGQKDHFDEQLQRTLATLRDTLLPKLLSGELRVGDTEHVVVEAI